MVEYQIDSLCLIQDRMSATEVMKSMCKIERRWVATYITWAWWMHIQAIITYQESMGTSVRRKKWGKRWGDGSNDQCHTIKRAQFWIAIHQRKIDAREWGKDWSALQKCSCRKKYKGTTEKQKLLTDPFVYKFENGASNEG